LLVELWKQKDIVRVQEMVPKARAWKKGKREQERSLFCGSCVLSSCLPRKGGRALCL